MGLIQKLFEGEPGGKHVELKQLQQIGEGHVGVPQGVLIQIVEGAGQRGIGQIAEAKTMKGLALHEGPVVRKKQRFGSLNMDTGLGFGLAKYLGIRAISRWKIGRQYQFKAIAIQPNVAQGVHTKVRKWSNRSSARCDIGLFHIVRQNIIGQKRTHSTCYVKKRGGLSNFVPGQAAIIGIGMAGHREEPAAKERQVRIFVNS